MKSLQLAVLVIGVLGTPGQRVFAQANVNPVNPIDYGAARSDAERPPSTVGAGATALFENEDVARAQADYAVFSLENRQAVFEWQYWSTIIIFVCVIALIGCGLYFSWTQFRAAPTATTQTSIKLGRDGLEINSPVIGLLILFLSLGFFYLYLVNVYPITEVTAGAATSAAESGP